MGQRYRSAGVIAVVVLVAVLASSCARGVDTAEVSARGGPTGASLPTSTTIDRSAGGSASASKTKTTTAPQDAATTAKQLVSQLAADPSLLSQLTGVDVATLSRLTGIDQSALANLQITPETVKGLATILGGLDPATLQRVATTGSLDPQVATTILTLAAQLDPATAQALKGIDPLAIASLLSAATTVDPKLLDALGGVLQVVDPNGLGKLATDKGSLAVLAILFGAALQADPSQFANLANAANIDPGLQSVLDGVKGLAAGLTPQVVAELNKLTKALGPDVLQALGSIVAFLGRDDIAPIIRAAAATPEVLVTSLGTWALLVPGLAEALAPDVFANNPSARYGALAALIGLAVLNLNGVDLVALAKLFGVPPPG